MSGKVFGYARVSTTDQDLTIQINDLEAAGVPAGLVFSEKKSGTNVDGREELKRLLSILREGDTLVITRIDRIARSMIDFVTIVSDLKKRGIGLKCTKQPIDTSEKKPAGSLVLNILGAVAEFETEIRKERQREGIDRAKALGVYKGANLKFTDASIFALDDQGIGPAEIARQLKCSQSTIFRALKKRRAPVPAA